MARKNRMRNSLRDSKGASEIEFALLAPLFLVFIFSIFDVSIYFFMSSQLQQALNDASRTVRTGILVGKNTTTDTTPQKNFKKELCNSIVPILNMNCEVDMRVDVRPYTSFDPTIVSGSFGSPDSNADGTITEGETKFDTGGASCAVVARVYYKYNPILPIGKLMNNITGTTTQPIPKDTYMMAATTFRNEPFIGGTGPACTFY